MAAVTGKLLHNVSTFLQAGNGEAAVGRSLVGADDRAARAGGSSEIFHLKYCTLHRFAGDRIILPHHQRRQRDILKSQHFGSARLDIDLLRGLLDGVPRGRLLLRYLVPAVPQTGELELAAFVGIESAKVIDLAAAGIVAGVGNMELCTLQGIAGHAVHLFDRQAGLLVILKINRVVAVGIERCKLTGCIQQIGGRHGFFADFVHTGQQVFQLRLALTVCLDLIDAVTVCGTDFKHGICDGLAGVGVVLIHGQVGALLVFDGQGAGSACEQFHVILPQVENMRGIRGGFLDGVNTGFQIGNQNLALLVGGAVEIMRPVLDLGDTEMNIFQAAPVRAGLNDLQRRLDGVGENKLCVLVGVKLNNTLRLVDDIALTGFFRHHIRAGGQLGKVNFAVLVGGKLLGAVIPSHGLNFKNCVGNDLAGVGAVYLDEPHTGLHIIEEQQLLDAVPCGQLHLLRRGVEDVTIASGVHLHGAVGAGSSIGQEDFAKLVRAEFAERNAVSENFKGDIGHRHHVLAVILDDPQTGQFLVHERKGRGFAGGYGSRIGGVVLQPAGGRGDLLDLVSTGLDVVKDGIARKIGFGGVGHAALDVLDLHHGTGQVRPGVGQLLDAERAVRLVPAGQLRHLAVLHPDILCGRITKQVVQGCHTLIHGVVARQRQGDGHGAVRAGGEGADSGSVGIDHLKNSATERGIRTLFQLDELQAGVRRFGLFPIAEIAVCGQAHGNGRIGVAHIILQLTVLVLLCAHSIKHSILINIGGKRKLDAAGLARHRSGGVQHLEFTAIAIPGAGGGDGGNILVVHVHDPRSCRDGGGIREGHADGVITYPCVGMDGEYLLLVLLSVHRDGIGGVAVGGSGNTGRVYLVPRRAAHIDVLGGGENSLRPLKLRTGQVGIDLQVVDVPVGEQVAPQRHLGRIVGVVLVLQLQFR